ncbi:hypothetical protein [Spirilliplanes yamanashiensis]|uniref:hypothetical protein n=1 Tax=Spirilliplanes yamanashiensis TaxID=42233 RepID=UPI001950D25D|nr:hypothetical protein [Spirilliplanes yamanashiensis]MDP9819108.1 hypothetical protein [Spirilliplanes yamanashiensis]
MTGEYANGWRLPTLEPADDTGAPAPAAAPGVVTVGIGAGGLVEDVRIDEAWRGVLTPAGLGDALLTAYRSALAGSIVEAAPAGGPGPGRGPAPRDEPPGQWLRRMRGELDDTARRLAAAALPAADGGERSVWGPRRHVLLLARGREVRRVQVNVRGETGGSVLAGDALVAFREVGRAG